MALLSPAALQRGRSSFFVFNCLNSSSFVLLSGSFVTLYALSLGASNATVGLLNAFGYGTFFFLPLGKRIVRDRPILRVFGLAWFWRFVAVSPALAAPFLVAYGLGGLGFALILVGIALFNMLRGVGLIGNNPVLANLAAGGAGGRRADKGAFLVNVQIIGSLAGMGTNLVVALVIGSSAPPWAFAAAMGVGIAVGIVGSLVLLKYVPEPEGYRSERSVGLAKAARDAFKEKPLRAFMEVLFLLSLVAGMARTFLPVYAKDVFSQGDDEVMAYSLVASVGALAMGLLTRLLVDRLGAKPLYVVFAAVTALSIAPLALAPGASRPARGAIGSGRAARARQLPKLVRPRRRGERGADLLLFAHQRLAHSRPRRRLFPRVRPRGHGRRGGRRTHPRRIGKPRSRQCSGLSRLLRLPAPRPRLGPRADERPRPFGLGLGARIHRRDAQLPRPARLQPPVATGQERRSRRGDRPHPRHRRGLLGRSLAAGSGEPPSLPRLASLRRSARGVARDGKHRQSEQGAGGRAHRRGGAAALYDRLPRRAHSRQERAQGARAAREGAGDAQARRDGRGLHAPSHGDGSPGPDGRPQEHHRDRGYSSRRRASRGSASRPPTPSSSWARAPRCPSSCRACAASATPPSSPTSCSCRWRR